jgi:hypothetical protein
MKKVFLLILLLPFLLTPIFGQHGLDYGAFYTLTARHSFKTLAFPVNGDHLVQKAYNSQLADEFHFKFIPHPDFRGYYWVYNRAGTPGYLSVDATNRPYLIVKDPTKKDIPEQLFKLVLEGSDEDPFGFSHFQPKVLENGSYFEYLDIESSSTIDNARVVCYPKTGNTNQDFLVKKSGENIRSRYDYTGTGCDESVETTLFGGRVRFIDGSTLNPAPIYTTQFFTDSTQLFNVSIRELKDNFSSEIIRFIPSSDFFCPSTREFFLDGQSLGSKGTLTLESIYSRLVKDANTKPVSENQAFHLITIDSGDDAFYIPFYVTQTKVYSGIKGSTLLPEIPQLILHDPPGDLSSSYLKKSSNVCHGISMGISEDASNSVYGSVRLGAKGSMGFLVETEYEAYGELSASATMGVSTNSTGDFETCFEMTEDYYTSNSDLKGTDGDVYIGFAQGLDYGIESRLECDFYNGDAPRYETGKGKLVVAPSTTIPTTKFVYTESHIKNSVIPDLQRIINDPAASPLVKEKSTDQLNTWMQVLDMNQAIQNDAGTIIQTISFSANTGQSYETSTSTTNSQSIELAFYLDAEVGLEIGAYVGGSGAAGGVKTNMSMEFGKTSSSAKTFTNTVGYILEDDDDGDYFGLNVKSDKVFGTPVFELLNSSTASSCPYEGGFQLDQPDLKIAPESSSVFASTATVVGQDPSSPALYRLKISNNSTDERTYLLRLDPNSNPDGAIIRVGGTVILGSNNWVDYTVPPAESLPSVLLDLSKGANQNINDYGPIRLLLYSECEPSIESVVTIYASFNTTGTTEVEKENASLQVFPNPSSGEFTIKTSDFFGNGTLQVLQTDGKIVFETEFEDLRYGLPVRLENITRGLYLVKVFNATEHRTNKVFINP